VQLDEATEVATRVRALYHQLEERIEGSSWSPKDDMLGLVNDTGALGRLVMATEGRWKPEGDLPSQISEKLADCLWWILVLSDRLDVDIAEAFVANMERIELGLKESIANS
jgi:NTP pyrophosphatase (non-canonical NTP hydrolase)